MTSKERTVPTIFKELLKSEAINIDRLKQDIQKISIPAELKPFYWKILLGIVFSIYKTINKYLLN